MKSATGKADAQPKTHLSQAELRSLRRGITQGTAQESSVASSERSYDIAKLSKGGALSTVFGAPVHSQELRLTLPPPADNPIRREVSQVVEHAEIVKRLRSEDKKRMRMTTSGLDALVDALDSNFAENTAEEGGKREGDAQTVDEFLSDKPTYEVSPAYRVGHGENAVVDPAAEKKISHLTAVLGSTVAEAEKMRKELAQSTMSIERRDEKLIELEAELHNQALKIQSLEQLLAKMKQRGKGTQRASLFERQSEFSPSGAGDSSRQIERERKRSIVEAGNVLELEVLGNNGDVGPTGEVFIVVSHIQGASTLWDMAPVSMNQALHLHNAAVRLVLDQFDGYEVKTRGDSFMAVFEDAEKAIGYCMAVQEKLLHDVQWGREFDTIPHTATQYADDQITLLYRGPRIAMAVHFGEPLSEPDPMTGRTDYFGPAVNLCCAVDAVVEGGQVVITESVLDAPGAAEFLHTRSDRIIMKSLGRQQLLGSAESSNELRILVAAAQAGRLPNRSDDNNAPMSDDSAALLARKRKNSAKSANLNDDRIQSGDDVAAVCIRAEGLETAATELGESVANDITLTFRETVRHAVKAAAFLSSPIVEARDDGRDKFLFLTKNVTQAAFLATVIHEYLLAAPWRSELMSWGPTKPQFHGSEKPAGRLSKKARAKKETTESTNGSLLYRGVRAQVGVHWMPVVVSMTDEFTGTFRYGGGEISIPMGLSQLAVGGESLLSDKFMVILGMYSVEKLPVSHPLEVAEHSADGTSPKKVGFSAVETEESSGKPEDREATEDAIVDSMLPIPVAVFWSESLAAQSALADRFVPHAGATIMKHRRRMKIPDVDASLTAYRCVPAYLAGRLSAGSAAPLGSANILGIPRGLLPTATLTQRPAIVSVIVAGVSLIRENLGDEALLSSFVSLNAAVRIGLQLFNGCDARSGDLDSALSDDGCVTLAFPGPVHATLFALQLQTAANALEYEDSRMVGPTEGGGGGRAPPNQTPMWGTVKDSRGVVVFRGLRLKIAIDQPSGVKAATGLAKRSLRYEGQGLSEVLKTANMFAIPGCTVITKVCLQSIMRMMPIPKDRDALDDDALEDPTELDIIASRIPGCTGSQMESSHIETLMLHNTVKYGTGSSSNALTKASTTAVFGSAELPELWSLVPSSLDGRRRNAEEWIRAAEQTQTPDDYETFGGFALCGLTEEALAASTDGLVVESKPVLVEPCDLLAWQHGAVTVVELEGFAEHADWMSNPDDASSAAASVVEEVAAAAFRLCSDHRGALSRLPFAAAPSVDSKASTSVEDASRKNDIGKRQYPRCGEEGRGAGSVFVFESPVSAVTFSLELQAWAAKQRWSHDVVSLPCCSEIRIDGTATKQTAVLRGPRIRVGIDYGPIQWSVGSSHQPSPWYCSSPPSLTVGGSTVKRASEIARWGYGCQILVSKRARDELVGASKQKPAGPTDAEQRPTSDEKILTPWQHAAQKLGHPTVNSLGERKVSVRQASSDSSSPQNENVEIYAVAPQGIRHREFMNLPLRAEKGDGPHLDWTIPGGLDAWDSEGALARGGTEANAASKQNGLTLKGFLLAAELSIGESTRPREAAKYNDEIAPSAEASSFVKTSIRAFGGRLLFIGNVDTGVNKIATRCLSLFNRVSDALDCMLAIRQRFAFNFRRERVRLACHWGEVEEILVRGPLAEEAPPPALISPRGGKSGGKADDKGKKKEGSPPSSQPAAAPTAQMPSREYSGSSIALTATVLLTSGWGQGLITHDAAVCLQEDLPQVILLPFAVVGNHGVFQVTDASTLSSIAAEIPAMMPNPLVDRWWLSPQTLSKDVDGVQDDQTMDSLFDDVLRAASDDKQRGGKANAIVDALRSKWLILKRKERQARQRAAVAERNLADVTSQLAVLKSTSGSHCAEVLRAHQLVRSYVFLIKQFISTQTIAQDRRESNDVRGPVVLTKPMTEEDFINKWNQTCRSTNPVDNTKGEGLRGRRVSTSTRDEFAEHLRVALEDETLEGHFQNNPNKLLRSIAGLLAKDFISVHKFIRKVARDTQHLSKNDPMASSTRGSLTTSEPRRRSTVMPLRHRHSSLGSSFGPGESPRVPPPVPVPNQPTRPSVHLSEAFRAFASGELTPTAATTKPPAPRPPPRSPTRKKH